MEVAHSYEIRVRNHLSAGWTLWFEDMELRHDANGEMVLVGRLLDQSALHGVLARIRDLGLTLISVQRVDGEGAREAAGPRDPDTIRNEQDSKEYYNDDG